MALFSTIINLLLHVFVLYIANLIINYFQLDLPIVHLVASYFIVQTIRLHYGINSFAVQIIKTPELVIEAIRKGIKEESKIKGEIDGQ